MARTMITTTDNKFNPFTQFDRWKAFDEIECGYHSLSLLARVASTSNDFSESEMDQAVSDACDEICQYEPNHISPVTGKEVCYVKVTEGEPCPLYA